MYVILKIQVHFLDMPKIPMYCVMFLSELRSSPDALNTSAPQLLPAAFASVALNESSNFSGSVQNSCSESNFLVKLEYHFQICFYKCICPITVLGKLLWWLIIKNSYSVFISHYSAIYPSLPLWRSLYFWNFCFYGGRETKLLFVLSFDRLNLIHTSRREASQGFDHSCESSSNLLCLCLVWTLGIKTRYIIAT